MDRVESAVSYFTQGFNCAQSVLQAYCEPLGLERDRAVKVAEGFGGGMGSQGEVCGAVTGAYMVLGLAHGRNGLEDRASKARTAELVREFSRRFQARHESTLCRDLLGMEIETPEGQKAAREKKLFTTVCPQMVKDAAEILEEIL